MAAQFIAGTVPEIADDASSLAATTPSGIQDGDKLYALFFARSAATPPSGWTLVDQTDTFSSGAVAYQRIFVYEKDTVTSANSSTSYTFTSVSVNRCGLCYVVLRDAALVSVSKNFLNSTDTNQISPVAVSAASDNSIILCVASCTNAPSGSHAGPAGMTLFTSGAVSPSRLAAAYQLRNSGEANSGYFDFYPSGYMGPGGFGSLTMLFGQPAAFSVSGTVFDSTGAPAARTVRAYRRDTGALLGEVTTSASGGDTDFDSVVLLLDCNGTDGSTTITDSSGTPKTVTAQGNAQIDTAQSKYGGASLLLDGSGDWIQSADNAAFELGSSNFTIEFWMRLATSSGRQGLASKGAGGDYPTFDISTDGSGLRSLEVKVTNGSGWSLEFSSSAFVWTVDTWHHIALTRSGSTFTLWRDGVSIGTGTTSVTLSNNAEPLRFGRSEYWGAVMNGHLDDIRVTVGVCRYTATFTPPAAPHADTGPVLTGEYVISTGSFDGEVNVLCLDADGGTLENDLVLRTFPV
ncbi:MAG: LamG domain-containing protein [Hydrogenophaga sp.]|nr:LamG domain-containing protein [Hydrogenophaga sp.]